VILLESTVSGVFLDTHISFHVVIIEAFISSNLVVNHVFVLSFSLSLPTTVHFHVGFHVFLLHVVTV